MKYKYAMVALMVTSLGLMACSSDTTTTLPKYDDSDLKGRVAALESVTQTQGQAIAANALAISTESSARQDADDALSARLDAEEAARQSGDAQLAGQLASAVLVQSGVNVVLQAQISYLMGQLANILLVKIPGLQSQINNKASISYVNGQISQVNSDIDVINARLDGLDDTDASLQAQIDALSFEVDDSKVGVFKCNMATSEERFLKIGGKYYGVMNLVTTETIQVRTESNPITYTNLKLCVKYDDGEIDKMKLPGGNGSCPSSWSSIGGNTITVPAYSVANKTVVTSTQISLEQLLPGQSYTTTDGTTPCSYNGNGTNLVEVQ